MSTTTTTAQTVVLSLVSSSICCCATTLCLLSAHAQQLPNTRSWTYALVSNSSLKSRSLSLSPSSLSAQQEQQQDRGENLRLAEEEEERGRRHRRLLDPRVRRQRQDDLHHHQTRNNPHHHRQQAARTIRRYHHCHQHHQPAMHVRDKKILIFPQDGGYNFINHSHNNIHDTWSSILQEELSQKNRGRHNKNSSENEEKLSYSPSPLPPLPPPSPSSSSALEELEVSCLCLTRGLSNTIQDVILEDDRGGGMRISKLILRSCHVVHPDALRGLLDHPQIQLNLKCLELHNLSGSLTYQCIDTILESSNYQEQLEELTLNINNGDNGHLFVPQDRNYHHEHSVTAASASNSTASNRMILVYLFQRLYKLKNLKVLRLNGCQLDDRDDEEEYDDHPQSLASSGSSRHLLSPIQALKNHFREQSSTRDRSRRSGLKHLFLKCCQLRDESVAELIIAMTDVSDLNIETLDLVGNKCGQNVVDVLGQTLQEDLDVDSPSSASPVKSTNDPHIRQQSLTKLDLSHQTSDLSTCDFSKMAKALRTNTTLRILRLAGNRLDETSVSMLAKSLSHNTSIRHLDLAGVDLTNTGHQDLLQALKINQTVRYMNIKYNPEIYDLSQWVAVLRSDNVGLHHLEHSIRSPINGRGREYFIQQRNNLSYFLYLNRCGRNMVRMNYDTDRLVPLSLWPKILRRSMTKDITAVPCCDPRFDQKLEQYDRHHVGYRMDAIFYFLRYGSLITQS